MATLPSFTNPASSHNRKACRKRSARIGICWWRKAAMLGVIGMLIGGQIAEGHVVVSGAFDAPGTGYANGVAVQQEPGHHAGVVGGLAAAVLALVLGVERGEVQFLHEVGDEASQMALGKPVMEAKGQKQDLVEIAVSKPFGHARSYQI